MNMIKEHPIKENRVLSASGKSTISPDIDYQLFFSVHDLSNAWEQAAPSNNIFLQRTYLKTIENHPPDEMEFCYLIFYMNAKPVGVSACQVVHFNAKDSINRDRDEKDVKPTFWTTIWRYFRDGFAKKMDSTLLICGNMLLTGEHGFYFSEEIEKAQQTKLMDDALLFAQGEFNKRKKKISVFFIKEYHEEHRSHAEYLKERKYNEFTVQPNMILDIRSDWNSYDDYLAAMTSKYRVRAKRAKKKGKEIIRKELSEEEVMAQTDRLYELYENISKNASFNMVKLNKHYIPNLKKNLKDKFKLIGYYLEDQLVGYFTTILNGNELEAHFLGFEEDKNPSHQIYLNMLYDIIKEGFEHKVSHIVFARTALEIKSSVGATAHEMYCYLKHKNALPNCFFMPVYEYLKPLDQWQPRQPFKTNS